MLGFRALGQFALGQHSTGQPTGQHIEPRGGLEQLTATAWYGYRKTRQQLAREAERKKKKAKRTGVRHDADDVIAILLALT